MEGKFSTKPQRLKRADEVKKTHFQLGTDPNAYKTTSKSTLKPPSPSKSLCILSKGSRKTNFSLGSEKKQKISEFAKSFTKKSYHNLRPEVPKIDVKEHHAVLGTSNPCYYTTHTGFYKKKTSEVQDAKAIEALEKNLRKHHFAFGTDKDVQSSSFNVDYQAKTPVQSKSNNLRNDMMESHIFFGQHPRVAVSMSQKEFVAEKPVLRSQSNFRAQKKENFSFGSYLEKPVSTHGQTFIDRPAELQGFDSEKMQDLKSSHFNLGAFPPSYSLTSTQTKPKTSQFQSRDHSMSLFIQATHFPLGTDKNSFKSTSIPYNTSSPVLEKCDKIDTQKHLTSSFSFGLNQSHQTANNSFFKEPDLSQVPKTDPALIKDLKSHHFKIGQGQGLYKTTTSVLAGNNGPPGPFQEELLKDLRKSHFCIGLEEKSDFLPIQKKDFKPIREGKEDFRGLVKELNRSHFEVGDRKIHWKTENQHQFNWITPIPEP